MQLILTNWNKNSYKNFINYLYTLQDIKYKNFHASIVPNINSLIGIRTPILKKIAKEISKGNYLEFIDNLEYKYYEEYIIHGLIISYLKLDFKIMIQYINKFILLINNWAVCDIFCANLHIVKKYKDNFFEYITNLLEDSSNNWIRRFCFVILLDYFIEDKYLNDIFNFCNKYNTDFYYVKMAIAWLISICYIKYKDKTLIFLNNNNLDIFTHNKIIQKICESKRVSNVDKKNLKELKLNFVKT